jgi:phosphoglycolate phosphatase-like HAD superfamily hydrolase
MIRGIILPAAAIGAVLLGAGASLQEQGDQLPSWNDTAPKKAIVAFIEKVTKEGSPDFVPPAERIATFDNDGTLWAEQPIYFQFAFAIDRVKALAPQHPEWKKQQPFAAVLSGDKEALVASGQKGLMQIMAVSHSGMSTEEFARIVAQWFATARHPRFNRPYTDLVYQPMLELLTYLRANGFKTFIVSGGGVEFMRVFTDKSYGIPPEQIVGSSAVTKYQFAPDGKPELLREAKVLFIDDGPGKPNILVIFGDDIGQTNVSAYSMGVMGYRTPNIDRIAREGMMFTDYYAEQSCTAGRSAFITGNARLRTGLSKVGVPGATHRAAGRDVTIAELLKPLGYATGQFGKNHLGDRNEYLPTVHGFDEFFGNLYHLNAEEEPERFTYPRIRNSRRCSARAACCAARRRTRTIRPSNRAGAASASRPSRTPAAHQEADGDDRRRDLRRRGRFHQRQAKANKPFFCWMNTRACTFARMCGPSIATSRA